MSSSGPIYSAEQIRIPPELPEILKNYAKYIIKNQPQDIVGSSATYCLSIFIPIHPNPFLTRPSSLSYFTKLLNQSKQAGKDGKLSNAQLNTFVKKVGFPC